MTNDTIYFPSDDGPRALTIIQLGDAMELHLSTSRQSCGCLASRAMTYRKHGMTLMHSSNGGSDFDDFREKLVDMHVPDINEEAVRDFHERSLLQVPAVRIAVDLHYAKQRSIDLDLAGEERGHG